MTKTIHRFFVPPECIGDTYATITDPDQVRQISRVLRLAVGATVVLLDNSGREFEMKIEEITKSKVVFSPVAQRDSAGEPALTVRLFQALPKQLSKFEEVLKHGTEVGVAEFYPLVTAHCELRELRRRDRMEQILKEAAEQSERGKVPVLGPLVTLGDLLKNGLPTELEADLNLLATPRTSVEIATILKAAGPLRTVNLFIGPEGCFSKAEVQAAHALGFKSFSLGPRILRTEIAGVVTVAILLARE